MCGTGVLNYLGYYYGIPGKKIVGATDSGSDSGLKIQFNIVLMTHHYPDSAAQSANYD